MTRFNAYNFSQPQSAYWTGQQLSRRNFDPRQLAPLARAIERRETSRAAASAARAKESVRAWKERYAAGWRRRPDGTHFLIKPAGHGCDGRGGTDCGGLGALIEFVFLPLKPIWFILKHLIRLLWRFATGSMPTTRQEEIATGRAFLVVIIILLFLYIRKRIRKFIIDIKTEHKECVERGFKNCAEEQCQKRGFESCAEEQCQKRGFKNCAEEDAIKAEEDCKKY